MPLVSLKTESRENCATKIFYALHSFTRFLRPLIFFYVVKNNIICSVADHNKFSSNSKSVEKLELGNWRRLVFQSNKVFTREHFASIHACTSDCEQFVLSTHQIVSVSVFNHAGHWLPRVRHMVVNLNSFNAKVTALKSAWNYDFSLIDRTSCAQAASAVHFCNAIPLVVFRIKL